MPRGIPKKHWGSAMLAPSILYSSPDGGGGGGSGPDTPPPAADPKPGTSPTDADKPLGPAGEKALEAERNARKELEKQLAAIQTSQAQQRDAFAAALGLKPEELSDTDRLAGDLGQMREQLGALLKENVVLKVASEHQLSEEDRTVIAALPDEATMRTVAARLQAAATAAKPNGRPQADPPSSGGGAPAPAADQPGLPRLRAAYAASENT